jgi:hypothetical protein
MKRFLIYIFLVAGTVLFAQDTEIEYQPEQAAMPEKTPEKTYAVGDTGPAGGIIFFDRGFYGDGWRYLEAAPATAEFKAEWGSYRQLVTGTMAGVGFGKENTRLIVERLNALREINCAAQRCTTLDISGYKDWFLPSKDELDLMFKNLKKNKLGNFSNSWYWSSTEYGKRDAWSQGFQLGGQDDTSKDRQGFVRAIRSF